MQGSFYNLTLSWLIKHHFPPGPIHLTRTHVPTLPVFISVGNFKVQYMEILQKKGFELYAAYGNTGTDVRAYEAAGIPKERCGSGHWRSSQCDCFMGNTEQNTIRAVMPFFVNDEESSVLLLSAAGQAKVCSTHQQMFCSRGHNAGLRWPQT